MFNVRVGSIMEDLLGCRHTVISIENGFIVSKYDVNDYCTSETTTYIMEGHLTNQKLIKF